MGCGNFTEQRQLNSVKYDKKGALSGLSYFLILAPVRCESLVAASRGENAGAENSHFNQQKPDAPDTLTYSDS